VWCGVVWCGVVSVWSVCVCVVAVVWCGAGGGVVSVRGGVV